MKKKCVILFVTALMAFSMTACSDKKIDEHVDNTLIELRNEQNSEEYKGEDDICKYSISKTELNSVGTYQERIKEVFADNIADEESEDLVIVSNNDVEKRKILSSIDDIQKEIIDAASAQNCKISIDENDIGVTVEDKAKDVSEFINSVCVLEGLKQQIESHYVEWSIDVNVFDIDGERVNSKTVTNTSQY